MIHRLFREHLNALIVDLHDHEPVAGPDNEAK